MAYGFSRRATYKIFTTSLLNEVEAFEARACCQVHQGGNKKHTRPSKACLVLPPLCHHHSYHSLCCHPCQRGLERHLQRTRPKHTHKHTHMAQLLHDYKQALRFMVIGLSWLFPPLQQPATSNGTFLSYHSNSGKKKKKDYKTRKHSTNKHPRGPPNCNIHRDSINSSKRTDEERGPENRKHFRKQEVTRGFSSKFSRWTAHGEKKQEC